jgi:hypothetical protein
MLSQVKIHSKQFSHYNCLLLRVVSILCVSTSRYRIMRINTAAVSTDKKLALFKFKQVSKQQDTKITKFVPDYCGGRSYTKLNLAIPLYPNLHF